MASSPKTIVLLFLLTFLSSHQILARESQFFNKIPRNTNNNDVVTEFDPDKLEQEVSLNYKPDSQEPNFLPENENNGYGLYGHESAQLPSSTTTAAINVGEPFKIPTTTTNNNNNFPNSKYLPKNYNTEAYVTEPEGYKTTTSTVPENNNFPNSKYLPKNYNTESYVTEPEGYNYNGVNGNFNNYQQQQEERNNYYNGQNGNFKQEGYSTSEATRSNNYGAGFGQKGYNNNYYNGQIGNFKQEGYSTSEATGNNNYGAGLSQKSYTAGGGSRNNYNYYNGGNSYQKQGMSDTRFLENGKYYYDVNRENTRGFGNNQINSYDQYNNNNNNNAAMEEGYQNQQFQNFQDEVDMP